MVLWAGNLGYNKRPELFRELAHSCLGSNLHFVMLGGIASEERVQGLFANTPSNLEWKNRLSFDEATSYFDRATFFVNTSVKEGFPNTFIQAWLRGVPTLSIGVDPNQVITTNRLGYVARDLRDLRENLERFAGSPEEYVELANNAKRYGESHHTVEVMAKHFVNSLRWGGITLWK
jgi:glycosyltransferase involved in cell wall biosynthesis